MRKAVAVPKTDRPWVPEGLQLHGIQTEDGEPLFLKAQVVLAGTGMPERIAALQEVLPDFGGQLVWELTSLAIKANSAPQPEDIAEALDPRTDLVLFVCPDRHIAQAIEPTVSAITGSPASAALILFEEPDHPGRMPDHYAHEAVFLSCRPGEIVTQASQLAYVLFSPVFSRSLVAIDWSDILMLLKTSGEAQLSWGTAESIAVAEALAKDSLQARGFVPIDKALLAVVFARDLTIGDFEHAGVMVIAMCDEDAFVIVATSVVASLPVHLALFAIR